MQLSTDGLMVETNPIKYRSTIFRNCLKPIEAAHYGPETGTESTAELSDIAGKEVGGRLVK